MTLLELKEDRPTPKAVYNWRVYACAVVASFASCMIGYDSAFIGTTLALPSFTKEFDFASYEPDDLALLQSNIVSVYQAGAFFGSLFAYATSHFLGRRKSLFIFAAVFLFGAGIMLAANSDRGIGPILAGRVLAGIGVGGASNMVPIYISELAPPAVRGRLVGIYELGWQIGGLVGFWINYGVNTTLEPTRSQWLIPFAVQLIPGGLLFLGLFWIKESPRWLFSKGRRDEAMKILCWIRNLEPIDQYIIEEVRLIDRDLERYEREVGRGFWRPFLALKKPKVQWRFVLGSLLFLFQNGSGINAINYYSPTVFRSLGITGTNTGFLTTGLFGIVKTVLTFVWLLWLVDHVGRRRMLFVGAAGGSLCMWFIGSYIKIADPASKTDARMDSAGIAAVFFFYLWTAFYTPSWNGTPWVVNSEMFDQNTRSLGQASAAANNWFWNFIISRFTPQMFLKMKYGVYFFASLMILSIVFVFFLVPETKSVPLEAMDRLFEIRPVRKANKIVMEELQAQNAAATRVSPEDASSSTDEKERRSHQEEVAESVRAMSR
ncbi:putative hexose transport-related protein [Thermochaetoides thermophila DSM 1495]|uniref:Quinate transporter n=1 Tax=Chaetomium thermophilum (strain DSM 1495 / CBS 144.50 / IMI 039719) TaxID=759272 RepID=G0SAV8_CHATD|nr:putative hexose transport-related protein [Thermochaetoides thermophila DSM 1495]EGS19338.1 putative hexose transport-related protein [Thermochaetoides thermophila DSM 1495]